MLKPWAIMNAMKTPCNCGTAECDELRELLMQYADGQLDEAGCEQIKARIAACESCCEEVENMLQLKKIVKDHCGCQGAKPELKDKIRNLVGGLSSKHL